MISYMAPLIEEKGSILSVDERNLLATAFKNLVGQHRIGVRTVNVLIGN